MFLQNKNSRKRVSKTYLVSLTRPPRVYFAVSIVVVFAVLVTILLRTGLPLHIRLATHDSQRVDANVVITLNQKLRTVYTTHIKLSPAVEGTWHYKPGVLLADDRLVFTPKTYLRTATTYTVDLPKSPRLITGSATPPPVHFTTEKAPSLATGGIADLAENSTIAADYVFSAKLTSPNRNLRNLVLKTTPNIAFTTSDDDTTFSWKPTKLLPQGKKISFELYDQKNDQSLLKRTVKVAPEPKLKSKLHRTHVGQHDAIDLLFSQAIDPNFAQNIHFALAGSGTWKNDRTYRFTPKKVAPGKTYSYTISKGLRSKLGGITRKTIKGSFSTIGAVTVTNSSPWGQGLSHTSQTISFTFDQPVNHTSAQSHFSINSGTITGYSWSGNTLRVGVKNLGYQRSVYATLSAGVQNAGFGLPSTRLFSVSFTTEARSRRLNVPYYAQEHSSTCAVASLRMILAYYGIHTSEMAIVNRMGYHPTKLNKKTNPPTWDDPQAMFVGSVDGSLAKGTAAGPDAPPVAKAAESYGRNASAVTGIGTGWVAQQIYAGHPVALYGSYTNTGFTSWKTPSGRIERMNLTSHTVVITGVVGEPSAPIGFWVSDPLAGGNAYWSAGAVAADIARDAYRQAVVVY